ncbi:MAG TPA: hypothetical protein VLX68_16460 [Chitinivibrionales bacterium]|nr:hypothetical protein [Chitinivibrionales bacterium]
MKYRSLTAVLIVCVLTVSQSFAQKPVVGLDCFHNNEPTPHYTWQLTSVGGFSQCAQLILGLGADTASIQTSPDSAVLAPLKVFIIVDPDDSSESPDPEFVTPAEADAIDKWVQRGGSLLLLTNNKGNCDLTHVNILAAKFGITFNSDTYGGGADLGPLPANPLFAGCDTLHIVDMCTQTLVAPAQALFTLGGSVLISTALQGNGKVFAMGDPWLYNEYINSKDNKLCGTNVMKWLLGLTTGVASLRMVPQTNVDLQRSSTVARTFLPNGRLILNAGQKASFAHVNACIIVGPAGVSKSILIN